MIYRMIDEINKCLENECYISALMTALTLPDICGAIEYPNEGTTTRYKKWYSEHMGQYEKNGKHDDMPYASADVVYDLRCSLLHSGNPTVDLSKRNLTKFGLWVTENKTSGGCASCGELFDGSEERTLEIGINNLCFKLCALAKSYYEHNEDKFSFNYSIKDMRNYGV